MKRRREANYGRTYHKYENQSAKMSKKDFIKHTLEIGPDNEGLSIAPFYDIYLKSPGMLEAFNELYFKGIDGRYKTRNSAFSWDESLTSIIEQGTNYVVLVEGIPGVGKTTLAHELAFEIAEKKKMNPMFHLDPDDFSTTFPVIFNPEYPELEARITYGYDDTEAVLDKLPDNAIVDQDESDPLTDKDSKKTIDAIKAAMTVFTRAFGICVIFCCPFNIPIPHVRFVFRIMTVKKEPIQPGVDPKSRKILKILAILGVTTNKAGEILWQVPIIFDVNRVDGFYERYKPISIAVKRRRQAQKGQHRRKGGDVEGPGKEIADRYITFRNDPEHAITVEMVEEDQKGNMFKGFYIPRYEENWSGDMDINGISEVAWHLILKAIAKEQEKKAKIEQEKLEAAAREQAANAPVVNPGDPFPFDIDAELAQYPNQEYVSLFHDLQRFALDVVRHDQAHFNPRTGRPRTEDGIKKIEGWIQDWLNPRIGHAYEPHYAAIKAAEFAGQLKEPPICDKPLQDDPDCILNFLDNSVIIYAIKARYSTLDSKIYDANVPQGSKARNRFKPEIEKWKELRVKGIDAKMFVVYYDHVLHAVTEKLVSDPATLRKVKLFRTENGMPDISFSY